MRYVMNKTQGHCTLCVCMCVNYIFAFMAHFFSWRFCEALTCYPDLMDFVAITAIQF